MLKKTKNQNKGITLIALVITVIVLLILAGIGISMLSGDNNILKRAGEAKNRTELSSLKEEAQMVMLNRVTEKTTSGSNTKTLKEDLESGISGGQVEEIIKADGTTKYTDVCYVSKNGQSITVYEDGEVEEGKVSIWKGITDTKKDIECPKFEKDANNVWNWYIYTAGQLKFLADFVNNGNSLNGTENGADLNDYVNDPSIVTMSTDTTIYLMNNLDLGARQTNGELVAGESWTPIGGQNQLIAKFEGNNHIIRGVYVQGGNLSGIFGYSSDINYLTVKNSYVKGTAGVGGIVGVSTGKMNNCHNINTFVIGTGTFVGGVAGRTMGTEINDCSNSGIISGENNNVGGIVGDSSGTISGCTNVGKINGVNQIGGIAGKSSNTINDCNNSGVISGTNGFVGGIVGNSSGTISSCNNSGDIKAKDDVGGIVGQISKTINSCNNSGSINGANLIGGIVGYTTDTISSCNNNGVISGENNNVGGIVGATTSGISDCNNSGKTNGANQTGGIVGNSTGTISGCNNSGKTNGAKQTGGIVGYSTGTISSCNNSEAITGTYNVGGIAGDTDTSTTVSECNNKGTVKGNARVGGIIGDLSNSSSKVEKCNNSGQVTGKETYIGGIVGIIPTDGSDPSNKEPSVVSKCYNSGKIQGTTYTGGVIGTAAQYKSLIEKCYNLGEVTGTGNVGGIAGSFGRSSRLVNCYNINKVTGTNNVGGIAGNPYSSTCEIKNCYNIGNVSSGTTNLGGILGNNSNSSTIENSYYLEGTATLDVGSGSTNSLAKNKEYITQDFVTTANTTETIWKVEAGKNDGWPILNE